MHLETDAFIIMHLTEYSGRDILCDFDVKGNSVTYNYRFFEFIEPKFNPIRKTHIFYTTEMYYAPIK